VGEGVVDVGAEAGAEAVVDVGVGVMMIGGRGVEMGVDVGA